MSSSMFIENTAHMVSGESLDENHVVESGIKSASSASDSNLIVVYGKNGISFDSKGLENLIEEKTLSSISVIRLTSPTPSMVEEEAKAERLSEMKCKGDAGSNKEDLDESEVLSTQDERLSNSSSEDANSYSEGNDSNSDGDSSEKEGKEMKTRLKKRHVKKIKKAHIKAGKTPQGSSDEDRPEIVGLTVEEFYPPEDAKEMAKEILKLAGISTIKRTAEYEFQLFVIKNDHCYTPFTSPAQMKEKLAADKMEVEKTKTVARKIVPQNYASVKQFITQKKLQQVDAPKPIIAVKKVPVERDRVEPKIRIEGRITQSCRPRKTDTNSNEDSDCIDDDEEVGFLPSEEEEEEKALDNDLSTSDISIESENDRDSDLDFDVNNRNGRKRKVQSANKPKRGFALKTFARRNQRPSQEAVTEASKPLGAETTMVQRSGGDNASRALGKNLNTSTRVASAAPTRKVLAATDNTAPTVAKKQYTIDRTISSSTQQTKLTAAVRRGPIVQVGTPSPRNPQLSCSIGKVPPSPQPVKEIVINKVIASPKGGFTDIGALLSKSDDSTVCTSRTPTSSTRPQQSQKATSSSKGFMPLGIETAAKNQLPSQISIQTHQSSSELAAEHDKQLDLIDSIVKDEMEKSSVIEKAPGENKDIPQLVRMLESTERALESKKSQQINDFTSSNAMETEIDISNAALLQTPEDEIPADLLQHVVKLIEDDKTLQEAVDKEVFGEDNSVPAGTGELPTSAAEIASLVEAPPEKSKPPTISSETVPPVIFRTQILPQPQTKSIIQATLFNDVVTTSSLPNTSLNASKTVPTPRKEPIQIVRGNGRVITLPPIEAPTTRAKRRAQTQPIENADSSATDYLHGTLNESILDTSLQSNTSFSTDSSMVEKKATETSASRRRVSKEGNITASTPAKTTKKSAKKSAAAKAAASKHETEDDNDAQDDDDPRKLWCICRQPHNNRFMICCDVCEDWFHGTCVGVTKAMGLEMEQKSIDWTCPKCVKKLEEKKQRKITDMLIVKKPVAAKKHIVAPSNPVQEHRFHTTADDADPVPYAQTPTSSKQVTMPKKQLIEIKKIQSGQFISLKNLEEKKLPVNVISSAQKSFLPMSTTPPSTKSNAVFPTQPQRIILLQKVSAQKPDNSKKLVTHITSSQHPMKVQKLVPATINATTTANASRLSDETAVDPPVETTPCIVCKRPSRTNSIYCSDDCIRKHAQNAINAFAAKMPENPSTSPYAKLGIEEKKKKSKGLFEDLLSMADRKPKVERVNVFERRSGRFFTGSNAPTTVTLKKWLQDNPTFEVVQPGSSLAIELEKKQKQRSTSANKSSVNPSFANLTTPDNAQPAGRKVPLANTQTTDGQTKESSAQPKAVKQTVEQTKLLPTLASRPQTPKQQTKHPQHTSLKSDKPQKSDSKEDLKSKEKNVVKRQTSENSKKSAINTSVFESSNTTDSEPIRVNVRRTLSEHLLQRINEHFSTSAGEQTGLSSRPSAEYIEEFVKETESEMYNYFNRDTSSKYKAKYRSLIFNIKDRKNQTLFQKICAKVIKPYQLVRMSPEELASQELAQWRENEAKHQLEMIKKSELDLLSCAKNYVLKTHKGEEVIESKSTDRVNLDMTIPVEDVVTVLNNSTEETISTTATTTRKDYSLSDFSTHKETLHQHHGETDGLAEEKSKSANKEKEHGREKSHKSKDRHREKSKNRRRSRSRSRSRERKHKSHRDEKRDREDRDRERDKERDHTQRERDGREKEQRDRSREEIEKKSVEKKPSTLISSTVHSPLTIRTSSPAQKDKHKDTIVTSSQTKKDTTALTKPLEAFSLVDQILESSKTVEEAANLVSEKDRNESIAQSTTVSSMMNSTASPVISSSSFHNISQNTTDSDQEPTSTVSIASSPQDPYTSYYNTDAPLSLWTGNINMIDVASFQILIQSVVGNAVNLGKLLPEELDVVGRIVPDTVWDYISKIKKSPNKEIVILRLLPAQESETAAYTILYKYLHKRNRLGVIKTHSSQIKDFYIFPLGAGHQMPSILQPVDRVEFYEDPYRPDILVGIVIRVIGKRLSSAAAQPTVVKTKLHSKLKTSDSYTPPGSPKRKRLVSNVQRADDYDIDAIIKAPIVAKKAKPTVIPTLTTVDDQDEPYSPGCSSDDDLPQLSVKSTDFHKNAEEELKRKMDELNRQIAAQEMEIAGLLNTEPSKFMPPSGSSGNPNVRNPSLASISIPSNLSQILASIKNKPEQLSSVEAAQVSAAPPPPSIGSLLQSPINDGDDEYNPEDAMDDSYMGRVHTTDKPSVTSRLAQLSEAELLSMVPDDMLETTTSSSQPPPIKKSRFDEPPPPGV